jgi:hypothetical protein
MDPNVIASQLTFEIAVTFSNGIVELAYSPSLGWGSLYVGSQLPATLPGNIVLVRVGGWPSAPTVEAFVQDSLGGSAEGAWTWVLAQSPQSPVTGTTGSPNSAGNYGQDWRMFVSNPNSPTGWDIDPYLTIGTNPNLFMPDEFARLLTMAPGSLPWAPSAGFDLRGLINGVQNDLNIYKTSITNQILADPRVTRVTVNLTPTSPGVLNVSVIGYGTAGQQWGVIFDLSTIGVSNLQVG